MSFASIDKPTATVQTFTCFRLPNAARHDLHRPVLIFQGGGYSGCFWEWNAIFFKPGSPYFPEEDQPAVSGTGGERVLEAAKEGGLQAAVQAAKGSEWVRSDKSWHLCTTDKSWAEFDAEFNKGFVRSVCKAADRKCQCQKCKRWFYADEIVHTGYRGDGGIGIQFDDNHCLECADELHESYCAQSLWRYESMADRVRAIQQHNEENACAVSVFAARRAEAPISYYLYAEEPEYY